MTLQQKLLAKKSKKGFTLVELVVVIAILAILAAIAIPMVVNIIQSASDSSGTSQAATLNQECKSVYAGVKSGTIVTTSLCADGTTKCTWAATKTDTATTKTTKAKGVKVSDVMAYSGLNFDLGSDYWYVSGTVSGLAKGDIVFNEATAPANSGYTKLEKTTTLGAMYTSAAAAQNP